MMSLFGMKLDFGMIAQLGLAAMTGGTSLLATTALRTIGSQIAMSLIQQLGQQLGLPPSVIGLAQAAFASASGQPGLAQEGIGRSIQGFANELNLSPMQSAQLGRELNQAADKSFNNMYKIANDSLKKMQSEGDEEGGSILMRIATIMGKLMDDKMGKLADKANALGAVGSEQGNTFTKGDNAGGFNAKGQGEFGKLSAQVQALSQELSYLSQAISSSIKGIGEAASTVARK